MRRASAGSVVFLLLAVLAVPLAAQEAPVPPQTFDWAAERSIPETTPWGQPVDVEATRKILSWTTMPEYTNRHVDHIPDHPAVQSPADHFGDPIGKPGVLHKVDEVHGYLEALAAATPRVRFSLLGETEEGNRLGLAQVGSEANMARLDEIREGLRRLADPRVTTEAEAERLIAELPVVYTLMAGLHSPETGSPEMVMELAYRLAVSDEPMIREIRDSAVVFILPVTEPDGRDRVVDWIRLHYPTPDTTKAVSGPPYWGKYIYHDNNRDGLQLTAHLTQEVVKLFLDWRYPLAHDLHESVPYLYTSTGTGPYNPTVDPITVAEWTWYANYEVTAMTALGMPGVWTHGFYDGWNPTYLLWVTNTRNAMGRFYETFGNMLPWTRERTLGERSTSREWYRPNPPRDTTLWSLRNNTNYMETGVLHALSLSARNRERVLRQYWTKSTNSLEAGRTEAPYAYVVPRDQDRPADARYMLELLERQGIEVSVATEAGIFGGPEGAAEEEPPADSPGTAMNADPPDPQSPGLPDPQSPGPPVPQSGVAVAEGDYVLRMDQPYRNFILTLMRVQHFPADAPRPYDDVAWTFPLMFNVDVHAVDDFSILELGMERASSIDLAGAVTADGGADWWLVEPSSSAYTLTARLALGGTRVWAVESELALAADTLAPGSWLLRGRDLSRDDAVRWAREHGLHVRGVADDVVSDAPRHELDLPRIALLHTWRSTQAEGWVRYTFDTMGVPYTYLGVDDLRDRPDLRRRFDAIVFPDQWGDGRSIMQGIDPERGPLPYRATRDHPTLGYPDETDDMTGGMGLEGLMAIRDFVDDGGTFITLRSATTLPVELGLVRGVSIRSAGNLFVPGSLVRGRTAQRRHPLAYGYDETMPLHHRFGPYLAVDDDHEKNVVVEYGAAGELFLSGLVQNGGTLAEQPALVSLPSGDGHYVLFGFNPMQRFQNFGDFAFVWNALLNWNDLGIGFDEPDEEE